MADGPSSRVRRLLAAPSVGLRRHVGAPATPKVRFTREDARQLNERFALLDRAARRAIIRAVNRGEAMPRWRDAELAVGVARRQQRFWSRAWLLGPAIAGVQVLVTPIGWVQGLLLAAWGTLLLGMMAAWWWTRARRAEHENLLVVAGRAKRGDAGGAPGAGADLGATGRRRGRLPGAAPLDGPEEDEPRPGTAGPRPPRPRGRKRR